MKHKIVFIRTGGADVKSVLDKLTDNERKKAFALIKHTGDYGPPHNEQKCRSVVSVSGLFELKSGRIRITFCYDHARIVLIHAFIKRGGKNPQSEYSYAKRLRDQVLQVTR